MINMLIIRRNCPQLRVLSALGAVDEVRTVLESSTKFRQTGVPFLRCPVGL